MDFTYFSKGCILIGLEHRFFTITNAKKEEHHG